MTNERANPSEPVSKIDPHPERLLARMWSEGQNPNLPSFLSTLGTLTSAQLIAILSVDQWERWQRGERIPAEDYLKLYPSVTINTEDGLDLVYGEYLLREKLQENPRIEEFVLRFPHYAEPLRRQIRLHEAVSSEAESHHPVIKPTLESNVESRQEAQNPEPRRSVVSRSSFPSSPDTTPRIPGYQIMSVLGSGSMGVVYKARHVPLNRWVALKVVKPEKLLHPAAVQRLRREAQTAAQLHHPNIVTIYDAGEVEKTFYLAMEFVGGIDLQRLLNQSGPLSVERACFYLRQVALGLQHAHERGIVHRDIKPSNLIVHIPSSPNSTVADHVVKILDMGLALRVEDDDQERLTREGVFLGTPDFVAPEQGLDSRKADIRSDLYSLGCSFYYLITGAVPFPAETAVEKLIHHRQETAVPIARYRPDVPESVSALICKLMAKKPMERFQTPLEVVRETDKILGQFSTSTGAGNPPVRVAGSATPTFSRVGSTVSASLLAGKESLGITGSSCDGPARGEYCCFRGHTDAVKCVAIAPSGKTVLSAGLDRTLRLWDIESAGLLRCFSGHSSGILAASFSPDGTAIVSGSEDRTLRIWDLEGNVRLKIDAHREQVNVALYLPNGKQILSTGNDRTINLWDAQTGKKTAELSGHEDTVWSAAVSGDGRTAITGSRDRTVRLWDLHEGREQFCCEKLDSPVHAVALSSDGRLALSGQGDGSLLVWDVKNGRKIRSLVGHQNRILSVSLTPDSRCAVSGGREEIIRYWDVFNGREERIFKVPSGKRVHGTALTPDGVFVLVGGSDGIVRLWKVI